ncbi:MAG: hypothetical protein U0797_09605 [Gemmataceae bacterium]
MDQIPLVADQIEGGRKLVELLTESGFPVTAACWVKENKESKWYLFLVSPAVDEYGPREAYRRLIPLLEKQQQPFLVDPFEVKLIGSDEPLAKGIAEAQQRVGRKVTPRYQDVLGDVYVEAAYLYLPINVKASSA